MVCEERSTIRLVSFTFVLLSAVTCSAALAQPTPPPTPLEGQRLIGRLAGGPQVLINPDDTLSFSSGNPVILDDGRTLERRDGKWVFNPETPVGIKTVKPIDLAVYGDDMAGQRIRIPGVEIHSASVKQGIIQLPGSTALVRFDGLPRDVIKRLIEKCSGIGRNGCRFTVVATVSGRKVVDGWNELVDPLIEAAR